uniref:COMM domain-containing protein n=1 Tax=Ciona savignyi TaxID=51511 RepID=H2Z3L1_CIOSA
MGERIFTETPRFSKSVQLINGLEIGRFQKLLVRIIQNLHNKHQASFSEDEKTKLVPALELIMSELSLVLETLTFIFQQAAYHAMKPTVLISQLEAVKMVTEKCEVISEVWTTYGRAAVEKLKKHSFAPKQLQSVDWHLNLQLAQDTKSNMKEPNAIFQLNVGSSDDQQINPILLELNHSQLFNLYSKLETIQSQLDSLS